MTNAEILRIAMEQHAIDANCSPDDFTRTKNMAVIWLKLIDVLEELA